MATLKHITYSSNRTSITSVTQNGVTTYVPDRYYILEMTVHSDATSYPVAVNWFLSVGTGTKNESNPVKWYQLENVDLKIDGDSVWSGHKINSVYPGEYFASGSVNINNSTFNVEFTGGFYDWSDKSCKMSFTNEISGVYHTLTITYYANGGTQRADATCKPMPYVDTAYPNRSYNNGYGLINANTASGFSLYKTNYTIDDGAAWNTRSDGSGISIDQYTDYTGSELASILGLDLSTGSKSVSLYANWKATSKTVTYDANGGTGTIDPQSAPSGQSISISDGTGFTWRHRVTFDANGGTVDGESQNTVTYNRNLNTWNTKPDGSGTMYTKGGSYQFTSNTTLYAIWTPSTYSTTLRTPTRANCTFDGWYTAKTGGTKIKSTDKVTQDITVYARWKYKISYNVNGGDSEVYIPDMYTDIEGKITLSDIVPTSDGGTFRGWATSRSGSAAYSAGTRYTFSQPTTLYAIWGTVSYTVTFDLNGGTYTGSTPLVQTIQHGNNATPPTPVTHGDDKFAGWLGSYTNITSTRTIVAMWGYSPLWKYNGTKWEKFY